MEELAIDSVATGRRISTERILSRHFEGKESIMEMYMQTCLNERRWKEAKGLLVELLENETDVKVRVQRKQALARVCFSLRELPLPVNAPVPMRFWLSGLTGIPCAARSAMASGILTAGSGPPAAVTVEGVSTALELLTSARIPS